jgi:hypothetical protein
MLEHGGGNELSTAPGARILSRSYGGSRYDGYTTAHRRFAGRSRVQVPNASLSSPPLSCRKYSPPPPYHRSGPNHFTHSRPKSRTLGRVTRWLRRSPSACVPVFPSRLPPALKLASSSAWDWLTTGTGTLTLYILGYIIYPHFNSSWLSYFTIGHRQICLV